MGGVTGLRMNAYYDSINFSFFKLVQFPMCGNNNKKNKQTNKVHAYSQNVHFYVIIEDPRTEQNDKY